MTNMSIQPLWLTHFIEILLVLEFQLTKFIVGMFSYKAHFRPQISSNVTFAYLIKAPSLISIYATVTFCSAYTSVMRIYEKYMSIIPILPETSLNSRVPISSTSLDTCILIGGCGTGIYAGFSSRVLGISYESVLLGA